MTDSTKKCNCDQALQLKDEVLKLTAECKRIHSLTEDIVLCANLFKPQPTAYYKAVEERADQIIKNSLFHRNGIELLRRK